MPEAGIPFLPLPARGFDRGAPLSMVGAVALLIVSTLRAWRMIGRSRPDVVVGFGGYVSLPVGLAAVLRRVPLVLHEQNSVPGLANKVLSRWARAAGVTYPDSAARLTHSDRTVVTGNPVRPAVRQADRTRGREALGLGADDLVLLVFGGSRGARHLNDAMIAVAPALAAVPRLRVLHVAGRIEFASVRDRLAGSVGMSARYRVVEYIEDMGSALAAADLVVSRAGATSLAEITTIGRAAVLVPYPYATDDHQTLNARTAEAAGAAVVVPDAELDGPVFGDTVLRLLGDAETRECMACASEELGVPDAADRVAALATEIAANAQGGG